MLDNEEFEALEQHNEELFSIAWKTAHDVFISTAFALNDMTHQLENRGGVMAGNNGLSFEEQIAEIEAIAEFGDQADQDKEEMRFSERFDYFFSQTTFDAWLSAVFALRELDDESGLQDLIEELEEMLEEELEQEEQAAGDYDSEGYPLLNWPADRTEPWATAHEASKRTVAYMCERLEEAAGKLFTDGRSNHELAAYVYRQWCITGLASSVFEASVKKELGVALTEDEKSWLDDPQYIQA
jgi:hypothetical protein